MRAKIFLPEAIQYPYSKTHRAQIVELSDDSADYHAILANGKMHGAQLGYVSMQSVINRDAIRPDQDTAKICTKISSSPQSLALC